MSLFGRLSGWQRLWVIVAVVLLPLQLVTSVRTAVHLGMSFGVYPIIVLVAIWLLTVSIVYFVFHIVARDWKIWFGMFKDKMFYSLINRAFVVFVLASLPYFIHKIHQPDVWMLLGWGDYTGGWRDYVINLAGSGIGNFFIWISMVLLEYICIYAVLIVLVFCIKVVSSVSIFIYMRLFSIVDWVADGFVKKGK